MQYLLLLHLLPIMERSYTVDKTFEKTDFTQTPQAAGDYENCRFVHCNFPNADLSKVHFTDCEFSFCNLGMAKLAKTAFHNIRFIDCKLLGLHFQDCDTFLLSFHFENCDLKLASFYELQLTKTNFKNCKLHEVDFAEANLSHSVFENCDFTGAIFENTNLEKCDFTTSYNYSINPELNKIRKAKFSLPAVIGLLHKYDIEIK